MKNEDVELRLEELVAWADEMQQDTRRLHQHFEEAHTEAMRATRGIREDADAAIRAAIAEVRADRMWTIMASAAVAGVAGGLVVAAALYFLFGR